jgi:ADP-ribosylglycohydrolase
VPAALGILYLADGDPAETILGCANFGRDADTIATIGGAIAGALRGADRIPAAWIETVGAACPIDQWQLARDLLSVLLRRAERAASWGTMIQAQSEY